MDQDQASGFSTYWGERGQPWRTEPEIGEERRRELGSRREIIPDVERGEYPFRGMRLDRADIEWLLATHENGRGPVDPTDEAQKDRLGLDLRGADLSYVRLSDLPLARTAGRASTTGYQDLTFEQRRTAAINLRCAMLVGTHLEDSLLDYVDLSDADLTGCHLEGASLWAANLREANCDGAHFEGADLWNAHLDGAFLNRAYFQEARLHEAYLPGSHFYQLRLADEDGYGPMVADIHWEGVNLSVVNWSEIRLLGDDRIAMEPRLGGFGDDPTIHKRMVGSAVRANQQLGLALQAQGISDDAGRFFYRARVLDRKLLALSGTRHAPSYLISLLLDILTGYGYRMGRMVIAYIALITLFAACYYGFGQSGVPHVDVVQSVVQSITAFHGRVFDPGAVKPDSPDSIVASFEAITGFLFEGLFIAMLAQRVFGR